MNNTFYAPNDYRHYLEHHGVKGMKWGVRRYQNADGSYTSAGKSRYGVGDRSGESTRKGLGGAIRSVGRKISGADLTPEQRAARNAKIKKAAVVVGTAAATAALAYAGTKYLRHVEEQSGAYIDAGKTSIHVAINNAHQNHVTLADIYKNDAPDTLANRLLASEHATKARMEKTLRQNRENDLKAATYSKSVRNLARREVVKNDLTGLVKGAGAKGDAMDWSKRRVERALWQESGNTDIANLGKHTSNMVDFYIKNKRRR